MHIFRPAKSYLSVSISVRQWEAESNGGLVSERSLIKTSNYYVVSLSDVRSLSLPRRESIGRRVGRGTWEDRNTCDQFWFERLLLPKLLLLS